jgi:hypothetical protein
MALLCLRSGRPDELVKKIAQNVAQSFFVTIKIKPELCKKVA